MCKAAWSKKYQFIHIDATQDELDGKYAISFLSKFKILRNESESFTTRHAEEEPGWKAQKKFPWQHKFNLETSLPAGKYAPLRNKLTGGHSSTQSRRFVL